MNPKCKGCYFRRHLGGSNEVKESSDLACHYAIFTGELRGVPPEKCTHKLIVKNEAERKALDRKYINKSAY